MCTWALCKFVHITMAGCCLWCNFFGVFSCSVSDNGLSAHSIHMHKLCAKLCISCFIYNYGFWHYFKKRSKYKRKVSILYFLTSPKTFYQLINRHHVYKVEMSCKAGSRGRARGCHRATLGEHPLAWFLGSNRLEEVCGAAHLQNAPLLTDCCYVTKLKDALIVLLILLLFLLALLCTT